MASPYDIIIPIQLQANNVGTVVSQIQQQLKGISGTVNLNTAGAVTGTTRLNAGLNATATQLARVQTQASSASAGLNQVGTAALGTSNALASIAAQAGTALRRLVGFAVLAGTFAKVTQSIRSSINEAIQFELAMNKVVQVSGQTSSRMDSVKSAITSLSTELGVSSSKLAESAILFAQAGLKANELESALKAVALADLTPNFASQTQAANGLIAAMNQFKISGNSYIGTLGAINSIAGNFAADASDITTAIQRSGAAFKNTGGDLNEFIALFTTVRTTTRENADGIASGLKTIFTRLQKPETIDSLKELQIELRHTDASAKKLGDSNLAGQFVGGYEAIKRISEALRGLKETDPRQIAVIDQIGGYRQINRVIPLIRDFATAQKALTIAQQGQATLEVQAEKRQDTLATKVQKVKEEYLALARTLVDSKGFQQTATTFLSIASALASILQYVGPLIPLLTTFAAIKFVTNIPSIFTAAKNTASYVPSIAKKAGGGPINVGSGTHDDVPALLMKGEYVLNRDAVSRIGVNELNQWNSGVKKFAKGGYVRKYAKGSENSVHELTPEELAEIAREQEEYRKKNLKKIDDDFEGRALVSQQKKTSVSAEELAERKARRAKLTSKSIIAQPTAISSVDVDFARKRDEQIAASQLKQDEIFKQSRAEQEKEETRQAIAKRKADEESHQRALLAKKAVDESNSKDISEEDENTIKPLSQELLSAKIKPEFVSTFNTIKGKISNEQGSLILDQQRQKKEKEVKKEAPLTLTSEQQKLFDEHKEYAEKAAKSGTAQSRLPLLFSQGSDEAISIGHTALIRQIQAGGDLTKENVQSNTFNSLKREHRKLRNQGGSGDTHGTISGNIASASGEDDILDNFGHESVSPEEAKDTAIELRSRLHAALGVNPDLIYGTDTGKQGHDAGTPQYNQSLQLAKKLGIKTSNPTGSELQHLIKTEADRRVSHFIQHGEPLPEAQYKPTAEDIISENPHLSSFSIDPTKDTYHQQLSHLRKGGGLHGLVPGSGYGKQASKEDVASDYLKALQAKAGQGGNNLPPVTVAPSSTPDPNYDKDGRHVSDDPAPLSKPGLSNAEVAELLKKRQAKKSYSSEAAKKFFPQDEPLKPSYSSSALNDTFTPSLTNQYSAFGLKDKEQDARFDRIHNTSLPLTADLQGLTRNPIENLLNAQVPNLIGYRDSEGIPENKFGLARHSINQETDQTKTFEASQQNILDKRVAYNPGAIRLPGTSGSIQQGLFPEKFRKVAGSDIEVGETSAEREARTTKNEAAISGGVDTGNFRQANLKPQYEGIPNRLSEFTPKFSNYDGAGRLKSQEQRDKLDEEARTKYLPPVDFRENPVNAATQNLIDRGAKEVDAQKQIEDKANKTVADKKIATGGVLSSQSESLLLNKSAELERKKVFNDLLSAEKKILEQTYPQIGRAEANKLALENVKKALDGHTKIIKDASGKTLGTKESVDAAASKGIAATGTSKFTDAINGLKGKALDLGNFIGNSSKLSRFGDNKLGKFASSPLFNVASTAGLSLAGGFLERSAGTADDAVKSGSEDKYTSRKAVGGALQSAVLGATVGATLGSAIPVIGTVIGGAVGAIGGAVTGFVGSMQEAAQDIRQSKINVSLETIGDKFQALASGTSTVYSSSLIKEQLSNYQTESVGKDRANATHFFGGFDEKEFKTLQDKSSRQDLSPLIPNIHLVLQKQANQLGKNNLDTDNIDTLVNRFKTSGDGLNTQLLELISKIQKLPIEEVDREIRKYIIEGKRNAEFEKGGKDSRSAEEKTVNSFGRLLLAVQSASDSLNILRDKSQVLTDAFDGTITAQKQRFNTQNLEQFGREDKGALEPLNLIATIGGKPGQSLRDIGKVTDDIARVLPEALSHAIRNAPTDSEEATITGQVNQNLKKGLGFEGKEVPVEVQRALNIISHSIDKIQEGKGGLSNIYEANRIDSTKFGERLLEPLIGPLKEFGTKIGKELQDFSNELIEGITRHRQQQQQIGAGQDEIGFSTQAANLQRQKDIFSTQGLSHTAEDRIPLSDLLKGFTQRQGRLVESAGLDKSVGFSPNKIGEGLSSVNKATLLAEEKARTIYNAKGPEGPEFKAAADEITRLKAASINLTQALNHLINPAEQLAAINEKLVRIEQEKDSRRNFAEKYGTASPEERISIDRGLLIANTAYNQKGGINNFFPEDRKNAFDSLRALGNSTLSGFNGSPKAADVITKLQDDLAQRFGSGLNPDQKNEESDLKTKRQEVLDKSVEAGKVKNENLGNLSADFFNNLTTKQNDFFSHLKTEIDRLLATTKKNDTEAASSHLKQLEGVRDTSGRILQGIGITGGLGSDAKVAAAHELKGQFQTLISADKKSEGYATENRRFEGQNIFEGAHQEISEGYKKHNGVFDSPNNIITDITEALVKRKVDPEIAAKVAKRAYESGDEKSGYGSYAITGPFQDVVRRGRDKAYSGNYESKLQDMVREEYTNAQKDVYGTKEYKEAERKVQNGGFNPNDVVNTANQNGIEKFFKAIDDFSGDRKIEALGLEIEKARKIFESFNKASTPDAGSVQAKSSGGNIFSAKGTDTVPAMLTPKEFVVNKDSAEANIDLLRKINSSKGALHLANGGYADKYIPKEYIDDGSDGYSSKYIPKDYIDKGDKPRTYGPNLGPFDLESGKYLGTGNDSPPEPENKEFADFLKRRDAGLIKNIDTRPRLQPLGPDTRPRLPERQGYADNTDTFNGVYFGQLKPKSEYGPRKTYGKKSSGDGLTGFISNRGQERDPEIDAVNDELRFQAKSNPFGASAQYLAKNSGASNNNVAKQDEEKYGAKKLAQLNFAGNIANFNQRSYQANAINRPGQEGQRSIYGNSIQRRSTDNNKAYERDFDAKRYEAERIARQRVNIPIAHFAQGGVVGGNGDSVPALLTPGEVVLNKNQQNNVANSKIDASGFTKSIDLFQNSVSELAKSFSTFYTTSSELAKALSSIPSNIKLEGTHTVYVYHNGAEVLGQLEPQMKNLIVTEVGKALNTAFKEHLPDANIGTV